MVAITFVIFRMGDESLSVRAALYIFTSSRTIFRCFLDTTPSATAMPCNRESLNCMPQLRVRPEVGFREKKGEERRAKQESKEEMEGKFGCLDLHCFKSGWRTKYLAKN